MDPNKISSADRFSDELFTSFFIGKLKLGPSKGIESLKSVIVGAYTTLKASGDEYEVTI